MSFHQASKDSELVCDLFPMNINVYINIQKLDKKKSKQNKNYTSISECVPCTILPDAQHTGKKTLTLIQMCIHTNPPTQQKLTIWNRPIIKDKSQKARAVFVCTALSNK